MMKFVTGVLSGVVVTTIGIVTAAVISIEKENKAERDFKFKSDDEILITGSDYSECAKKLRSFLCDKTNISTVMITFLGNGSEMFSEIIEKMRQEIIFCVDEGVKIEWKVGAIKFMDPAISVVISY